MTYEKQSDALNKIEKNSEEDLSSSSEFLTPDQYPIFWKKLLTALQTLSGTGKDEVIKQGDIKKEKDEKENIYQSLLSYIEEKCDLPDETEDGRSISLSTFYKQIKEDAGEEDKFFWNESLEAAVRHFLDFFTFKDDQVLIKIPSDTDEHSITVGTIREADAGYSFNPAEWVRPFWNINDKNYNEVRGHDQVNDILRNENKLQYTREKFQKDENGEYILDENKNKVIDETYKWLRLLMPQYGRRVETEDLNRNWWVIAQVIAAISDFLFDDDSPIENMFDYFLRELTELWENMLYLWLEVAMASQKTNDGVRVIVLPLQADSNRTDKRFDNFDEIISFTKFTGNIFENLKIYGETDTEKQKKAIFEHIKYLAEEYSEQNLCIIPFIRIHNYKHNYYSGEYYPYVFIYNQKEGDYSDINNWKIDKIHASGEGSSERGRELVISLENDTYKLSEYIYAFKYNKDEESYSYMYPFSNLSETETDSERVLLYGGVRTEVEVSFNKSATEIEVAGITISIYDAIRKGIDSNDNGLVGTFINKGLSSSEEKTGYWFEYNQKTSKPADIKEIQSIDCYNLTNAAYLGECVTWKGKTSTVTSSDSLFTDNAVVLKVGNYLPTNYGNYIMSVMQGDNGVQYFTSMYGNLTVANVTAADTKYLKFDWSSYNPNNDGSAEETTDENKAKNKLCFNSEKPGEWKPSNYPTQNNLAKDGLNAVKHFISKWYNKGGTEIGKKPLYLATCVGLTPWAGNEGSTNNAVYWDSAFIAHLYFYIPNSSTIVSSFGEGDLTNYESVYSNATFGTSIAGDEKEVRDKNGKIIGKIVGYVTVDKFEGYANSYSKDIDHNLYYPHNGNSKSSRWRQFFMTNDGNNNSLIKKIYNDGESVRYDLSLSDSFSGFVRYFDVYLYSDELTNPKTPIYTDSRCQISSASVKISKDEGYVPSKTKIVDRSSGENVSTFEQSSVVSTTTNVGFYDDDTNLKDSKIYTPFQRIGDIKEDGRIGPSYFCGDSKFNSPVDAYCVYKI